MTDTTFDVEKRLGEVLEGDGVSWLEKQQMSDQMIKMQEAELYKIGQNIILARAAGDDSAEVVRAFQKADKVLQALKADRRRIDNRIKKLGIIIPEPGTN